MKAFKVIKIIKIMLILMNIIGVIIFIFEFLTVLTQLGVIDLDYMGGGITLLQQGSGTQNASSASVQAILDTAEKIAKYMKDNNFYYSLNTSELGEVYTSSTRGSCCATYVSWILQDLGLIATHTNYSGDWDSILGNDSKWERFTAQDDSDLQPGDINVFGEAHTNIYAGNSTCWDAGDGSNGAFLGTTKAYSVTGDGRYTHSYRYKG